MKKPRQLLGLGRPVTNQFVVELVRKGTYRIWLNYNPSMSTGTFIELHAGYASRVMINDERILSVDLLTPREFKLK